MLSSDCENLFGFFQMQLDLEKDRETIDEV